MAPFETPYIFRQKRLLQDNNLFWEQIDTDYSKPLPDNYPLERPHVRWTQAEVWLTGLYKALHDNNDLAIIMWREYKYKLFRKNTVTVCPGYWAMVEGRENIEFIFQEMKKALLEKKRHLAPIEESLLTLFDWEEGWTFVETPSPIDGLLDDTGRPWPISVA